jgi:hypothetical protein
MRLHLRGVLIQIVLSKFVDFVETGIQRIAYSSTIRLTWVIPQDLKYHLNFYHRDPGIFHHPGNRNCTAFVTKFYY